MPKSLKQVMDQIEKLEKQAAALRAKEAVGVVARIKEAISHYGLTEKDLFSASSAAPAAKRAYKMRAKPGSKPKGTASPAKYHDGAGKTWTGVGKRPNWFKAAIDGGKTAEDLLIKA